MASILKNKIKIKYLDGLRFERAVIEGLKKVRTQEEELNRLNVFPIPDNDTGSNLKVTFRAVVENLPLFFPELDKSSAYIARKAISSALGYSGIIFSNFLLGLAEGLQGRKKITVKELAQPLKIGVKKAYDSLAEPAEGTILSVLKAFSDEVSRLCLFTEDFVVLLNKCLKKANRALLLTPTQLEVLKRHGVVDAGGQAFVYFLEGILDFIHKGKIEKRLILEKRIAKRGKAKDEKSFCAECCVHKNNVDRLAILREVRFLGEELLFYSSTDLVKLHVRTDNPEKVFRSVARFGEVRRKKVFKFGPDLHSKRRKSLAITVDSSCDIEDDYVENNNIYFIPLKFITKDRVFVDRMDIIPEDFYGLMRSSPSPPKTSQPGMEDFRNVYQHLLIHFNSIISVHLSASLSGTFHTACRAAEMVEARRIKVIDGKSISVGLGLIVVEGIKALRSKESFEKVVQRIKNAAGNIKIFIGIPTLKYLVRGGRVSFTKGLVASLLKINPILSLNSEGRLVRVGKSRGKMNMEKKVLEIASANILPGKVFSLAVAHTNAPFLAQKVVEKLETKFKRKVAMVRNASPVLGAHGGPGAVGIGILESPL